MPVHQAYLQFNSGEITPYLAHTTDFSNHASGASRMENFLPMPFGGLRKRPGTIHLAALDAATRLQAFNYSTAEQFVLAFSATALTIYAPDGTVEDEIAAVFADPYALQFAQLNDVVFIAEPSAHPRRLQRTPSGWELADIPFTFPPLLDENDVEEFTITTSFPTNSGATVWASGNVYATGARVEYPAASGDYYTAAKGHTSTAGGSNGPPGTGTYLAVVQPRGIYNRYIISTISKPLWNPVAIDEFAVPGTAVTLVSTADIFEAGHVGSVWRISKKRALTAFEVELDANSANNGKFSLPLVVQGGWTFNTFGTWNGTFLIQKSVDGGNTWEDIRSYESSSDRNVAIEGEERARCLLRMGWTYVGLGSSKPRGVLAATDAFISGLLRITAVADSKNATGEAITPIELTTTSFWTEGAFSDVQGYPAAIAVHEKRLIFGGTRRLQVTLWMSKSDDLLDFEQGTDTTSSLFSTLSATRQDPIRWIAGQRRLYVGTSGGEWVYGSPESDEPLGPLTPYRDHTSYGSAALPALRINDAIFFVERQGRRLREFAYLLDRESYDAADLTRLSEHITESGIVQMDWQANREPFLWAIRADGVLLAFAYHRQEKIAAWSRHTTRNGLFRSVAVLRNETGDDDVFFVVERAGGFHLEKLAAGQQLLQETGEIELAHFVDSAAVGATTGEDNELEVPDHLEGEILHVLADGIFRTAYVLESKIKLPVAAEQVAAGLMVESFFGTLPLDVATESGPTHARRKRANEVVLNLYVSFGGAYSYAGDESVINYTHTGDLTDSPPAMLTGWQPATLGPGHVDDLRIGIRHTEPYPFTLRAMVLRWLLHES